MAKKVTAKNVVKIMRKWADSIEADDYGQGSPGSRKEIAALLEVILNDMLDNDFFGTEGQGDPRGDHRDDR